MENWDDPLFSERFKRVVANLLIFFAALVVAAALALVYFGMQGCTTPAEPVVAPLNDQPCPPKRRCLFDSTGAVIAVVPLAPDDSCGCHAPVR